MSLGSIRRQLAAIPRSVAASLQSPARAQGANSALAESDLRAALDGIVRESLHPVAARLGVLYCVFAVSHRLVLPEAVAALMSLVAAGTVLSETTPTCVWSCLSVDIRIKEGGEDEVSTL